MAIKHLRSRNMLINHLCPASFSYSHYQAGLLSYPENIFSSEFEERISQGYSCISEYNNIPQPEGKCSFRGHPAPPVCPVTEENVLAAIRPMNWTHNFGRICSLINPALGLNITEFNVYIMGGSMTFGQSSAHFEAKEGDAHSSYCAWGRYLGRWLQSEFPHIKINVRNLAERGHGSRVASEFLLIRYPPGSSKSFRSTDIVFLDYSVNDCSGGYGPRVGTDIETLVRRFLHYGSDMPLVILLEGYPFQIAGQYFNWNIPGTGGVHDYTTYYRQVARYYNLPLWSFATSMFDNITVTQHFYPYIRNMASHPSWFVHLFMADLYSSVMKHQIHKYCVKEADQRKQEVLQISGTTSKMLPPTLYVGDEKECIPGNEHRQYHSNARTEYDRLRSSPIPPMDQDELEWEVYSEQTKEIVSSSSSPLHSDSPPVYGIWKLYEDRPTKAGWIINPAGDMEGASLRFRLQKVDFSAALVFPQSSQSDIFELMNMLEEHQFGYVVNYLVNSLLFGRIISNIVFL